MVIFNPQNEYGTRNMLLFLIPIMPFASCYISGGPNNILKLLKMKLWKVKNLEVSEVQLTKMKSHVFLQTIDPRLNDTCIHVHSQTVAQKC